MILYRSGRYGGVCAHQSSACIGMAFVEKLEYADRSFTAANGARAERPQWKARRNPLAGCLAHQDFRGELLAQRLEPARHIHHIADCGIAHPLGRADMADE